MASAMRSQTAMFIAAARNLASRSLSHTHPHTLSAAPAARWMHISATLEAAATEAIPRSARSVRPAAVLTLDPSDTPARAASSASERAHTHTDRRRSAPAPASAAPSTPAGSRTPSAGAATSDSKPAAPTRPQKQTAIASRPDDTRSTNVTLHAPPTGRLALPNVWKRSPINRKVLLYERTTNETLSNLKLLAADGRTPRPEAFHRVLKRANAAEDADVVTKALHICRSRAMRFTPETSTLLAETCVRIGRPDLALGWFNDRARTRLFPTKNAYATLLNGATQAKDAKLIGDIATSLGTSGLAVGVDLAGLLIRAHLSSGDARAALRTFSSLRRAVTKDAAAAASSGKPAPSNVSEHDVRPVFNLCKFLLANEATLKELLAEPEFDTRIRSEVLEDASKAAKPGVRDLSSKLRDAVAAAGTAAAAPAPAAAAEPAPAAA